MLSAVQGTQGGSHKGTGSKFITTNLGLIHAIHLYCSQSGVCIKVYLWKWLIIGKVCNSLTPHNVNIVLPCMQTTLPVAAPIWLQFQKARHEHGQPGPATHIQKGGRMIVLQNKNIPFSLTYTKGKKDPFFSKTLTWSTRKKTFLSENAWKKNPFSVNHWLSFLKRTLFSYIKDIQKTQKLTLSQCFLEQWCVPVSQLSGGTGMVSYPYKEGPVPWADKSSWREEKGCRQLSTNEKK